MGSVTGPSAMIVCSRCRRPRNADTPCAGCPPSAPSLEIDALRPYRYVDKIADGGFGAVYRCEHVDGGMWALKLIDLRNAGTSEVHARRSYEREAEALVGLDHPHIVRCVAHGVVAEDLYFLVLEYVSTTLARARPRGRRIPLKWATQIAVELADALAYLHTRRVYHRDVKPDNIGLDADDRVRLLDLGIAALRGPEWRQRRSTLAGFGTPFYAAPEQMLGGTTGPYTDIYAYGAVVYELVAGHNHLPANLKGTEIDHLREFYTQPVHQLPADPARPEPLDHLLTQCLAHDPADRVRDIRRIVEQISRIADWVQTGRGRVDEDYERKSKWLDGFRAKRDGLADEVVALQRKAAAARTELKNLEATRDGMREDLGIAPSSPGKTAPEKPYSSPPEALANEASKPSPDPAASTAARQAIDAEVNAHQSPSPETSLHSSSMFAALIHRGRLSPSSYAALAAGAALAIWLLVGALGGSQQSTAVAEPATGEISRAATEYRPSIALISAGTFEMGSLTGIGSPSEHPRHRVRLTASYWMTTTPVTQAQYQAVVGANPARYHAGRGGGPHHPVERVTWLDAVRYCNWLSDREGLTPVYHIDADAILHVPEGTGYRLPTEAEWEYACRAGTTTQYAAGDDLSALDEMGWYRDNAGEQSHPVGQKSPNAYGLHDMHGNVWEWVEDWRGDYPAETQTDPSGPARGGERIVRGGSFVHEGDEARSANRSWRQPEHSSYDLGFRVVRTADPAR